MCINNILSKLERVRRTGPHAWLACCPAHDDQRPSLAICKTDDGKMLVHCFAGCAVHEVVEAIGMEISDLFPPRQNHGKPERRPFPATDALRAVTFEALVVAAAGTAMLAGEPFGPGERERLMLAVNRIQSALSAVLPRFKAVRYE